MQLICIKRLWSNVEYFLPTFRMDGEKMKMDVREILIGIRAIFFQNDILICSQKVIKDCNNFGNDNR